MLGWFWNSLNKDKDRLLFCRQCGTQTAAENMRCSSCHKSTRSPTIPLVSLLLLTLTFFGNFYLYDWSFLMITVPFQEKGLDFSHGEGYLLFTLADEIIMATDRVAKNHFYLLGFISCIYVYLCFLWKPHRRWGPQFVLWIAVSYTLASGCHYLSLLTKVANVMPHLLEQTQSSYPTSRVPLVSEPNVTPPTIINEVKPFNWARDSGWHSAINEAITFEVVFSANGTIEIIRPSEARTEELGVFSYHQHLIDALAQWTYQAGTVGGEPADVRMLMTCRVDIDTNVDRFNISWKYPIQP